MDTILDSGHLSGYRNVAEPLPANPVALPYELRTEMTWLDFSDPVNPLGTPRAIVQTMHTALVDGELSYGPDRDGHEFRNRISRLFGYDSDWVVCGSSVASLISAATHAFRPTRVAVSVPCPPEYVTAVASAGHRYAEVGSRFSFATVDVAEAVERVGDFRAAVLANPGYPGSRLLPRPVLERYLDVCDWVIVDESYIELSFGGESCVDLCRRHPNLIVIRSISRTFCMPGVPISYIVAHPDTIAVIRRFHDGSDINMFAEVLAKVFVELGDYLEQTHDFLEKEIPWMQCMLNLVGGISISPAEGSHILCRLDSATGSNGYCAEDIVVRLQLAGFLVRRMQGYCGIDDDSMFCIAVRTRQDNERLLAALKRALDPNIR